MIKFVLWSYLLKKGLDLSGCQIKAKNLLCHAASEGKTDIVKLLVNHGMDINIALGLGQTPLYYASDKGHKDIVKFLLAHGANYKARFMNGDCLTVAAFRNRVEVARVLLEYEKSDIPHRDLTPLLVKSCYRNYAEMAQVFLEFGANINRLNIQGVAPIHEACLEEVKKVEALLEYGGDLTLHAQNGYPPIFFASQNKSPEVLKYLLEKTVPLFS